MTRTAVTLGMKVTRQIQENVVDGCSTVVPVFVPEGRNEGSQA